MITYVYGDLFQSPARVLVNTVNTVGVMGKGLAADFKRYYPAMFEEYRAACEAGRFNIGQLMVYRTPHKWAVNFPTRKHWRSSSHLEYIEAGLQKFVASYAEQGITSASFPRLAVGSGGLDWESAVRPLMEAYLGPLPISIYIHIHDPAREARSGRAIASWLAGTPQIVPFATFWRELSRLLSRDDTFRSLPVEGQEAGLFTVKAEVKRNARSLIITPAGADTSLYLSEGVLNEVWMYIQRAGYSMARNLPSGLEAAAPYLMGLLAQLSMVRVVRLAAGLGGAAEPQDGLHFLPPVTEVEARFAPMNKVVS
jgi:O-acetyl-ADP-ribose deacetylase (regulator of RNase III)